jgi:hypothetical protein
LLLTLLGVREFLHNPASLGFDPLARILYTFLEAAGQFVNAVRRTL